MMQNWIKSFAVAGLLVVIGSSAPARAVVSVAQLQSELKAGQYANVIKEVDAALPTMAPSLAPQLYMIQGAALAGEQKYASAALAYLRIPFCYPQNSYLASEALLHAAQIEAGPLHSPANARSILKMLMQDYAHSAQAVQAKQLLAKLPAK